VEWLVASLVLSVVLTVLLNVVIRVFPNAGDRAARRLDEYMTSKADDGGSNDRRVRVVVPWKAMLIGSLILTLFINVLLRLT
jgi:hypothetical protein